MSCRESKKCIMKKENNLKILRFIIEEWFAASERYWLWREVMSHDQGSPTIILCTPVKLQEITLI